MKNFFLFFLFLIIISINVNAISVGFNKPKSPIVFEPGLEREFTFKVYNNVGQKIDVEMLVDGPLAEYVKLDRDYYRNLEAGESFTTSAKVILPEDISTGGLHHFRILFEEVRGGSGSMGFRGAIGAKVDIRVRFPGKYLEAHVIPHNTQVGLSAEIDLNTANYGEETIEDIYGVIDVYNPDGNLVKTINTNHIKNLNIDKKQTIKSKMNTNGLNRGEYTVKSKVYYDGESLVPEEKTFMIGDETLLITNTTPYVHMGSANKFNVEVASEWNLPIKDVYAQVFVYNETGRQVSFKTPNFDVGPWKKQNISAYLDAKDLSMGKYLVNATVYYSDKTVSVIRELEVIEEKKSLLQMPQINGTVLIIGLIVILSLVANIFFFLYIRKATKQMMNNSQNNISNNNVIKTVKPTRKNIKTKKSKSSKKNIKLKNKKVK